MYPLLLVQLMYFELVNALYIRIDKNLFYFFKALENDDDSSDEFFIPRINGMSVPQSTWTDSDRQILLPCSGLIRATKACLKKTLCAVTERGNGNDGRCISELDDIADIVKTFSPKVDDFVLSLYPPVNHSAVKDQVIFYYFLYCYIWLILFL